MDEAVLYDAMSGIESGIERDRVTKFLQYYRNFAIGHKAVLLMIYHLLNYLFQA